MFAIYHNVSVKVTRGLPVSVDKVRVSDTVEVVRVRSVVVGVKVVLDVVLVVGPVVWSVIVTCEALVVFVVPVVWSVMVT